MIQDAPVSGLQMQPEEGFCPLQSIQHRDAIRLVALFGFARIVVRVMGAVIPVELQRGTAIAQRFRT